jgi:hypothetical protein
MVVEGRDGERLGTVHGMPPGPDASLAALLLSSPALSEPVRAALAAYVLSR